MIVVVSGLSKQNRSDYLSALRRWCCGTSLQKIIVDRRLYCIAGAHETTPQKAAASFWNNFLMYEAILDSWFVDQGLLNWRNYLSVSWSFVFFNEKSLLFRQSVINNIWIQTMNSRVDRRMVPITQEWYGCGRDDLPDFGYGVTWVSIGGTSRFVGISGLCNGSVRPNVSSSASFKSSITCADHFQRRHPSFIRSDSGTSGCGCRVPAPFRHQQLASIHRLPFIVDSAECRACERNECDALISAT